MQTACGRLVVLEGPNGVGKTSLAHALCERLRMAGVRCKQLSFPGREPLTLGRHIYELHHQPARFRIQELHPAALQILHIAAHVDSIERRIRPSIQEGEWVVLDRYWWSTWVYGRVDGLSPTLLNAILQPEMVCWEDLRATAIFLLRRSQSAERAAEPVRHNALVAEYDDFALTQKISHPVYAINNDDSMGSAVDRMMGVLAPHLNEI